MTYKNVAVKGSRVLLTLLFFPTLDESEWGSKREDQANLHPYAVLCDAQLLGLASDLCVHVLAPPPASQGPWSSNLTFLNLMA